MSTVKVNLVEPRSGTTLTLGASGDTVDIQTGATIDATGATITGWPSGGLSDASIWRHTSNSGISAGVDTTLTAWEEDDSTGAGRVRSAMTQSSGIFTFPSTGYWLITYYYEFNYTGSTRYSSGRINVTTNDSSYAIVAYQNQFASWSGDDAYGASSSSFIFDVTDTAQCKAKFTAFSPQAITVGGETTKNRTHILFMKLGAT